MARKGENIYKRKDGRWEGRYMTGRKENGKPRFHSIYGKTYSEVKKELIIIKSSLLTANQREAAIVYGNGCFADWMDYWLEAIERPHIRETTYLLYERDIRKHLKPLLGNIQLRELTREQIQNTADTLQKKLASSTLHGICRLLKSILESAKKNNLIIYNPYMDIRLPRFRSRKPKVLTYDEQIRLERVAVQEDALDCLIGLYTGVRLGELCALRYNKIDFQTGILWINSSVKRVGAFAGSETATALQVGAPKTENSIREIPLPFFISNLLKERMKKTGSVEKDYIFQNGKGGPADPRTVQKRMKSLFTKAEIQGAHPHTLRHTFSMRFLEQNPGAYKALSEILGHSSSAVTIKCYDNCTMDKKRQSMQKLRRVM